MTKTLRWQHMLTCVGLFERSQNESSHDPSLVAGVHLPQWSTWVEGLSDPSVAYGLHQPAWWILAVSQVSKNINRQICSEIQMIYSWFLHTKRDRNRNKSHPQFWMEVISISHGISHGKLDLRGEMDRTHLGSKDHPGAMAMWWIHLG